MLIGLTGEVLYINGSLAFGNHVLQPTLKDFDKASIKLKLLFEKCNKNLKVSGNKDLEECRKNKLKLAVLDELWALRHAHAIVDPWSETAKKKRIAKNKRLRQREKKRLLEQQSAQEQNLQAGDEVNTTDDHNILNATTSTEKKVQEINHEENLTSSSSTENEGDLDYMADYNAFVEEQKQLSRQKEQIKSDEPPAGNEEDEDSSAQIQMDKDSYNTFMDLYENKNVAFDDFVKAFKTGLNGHFYEGKGGSILAFQLGKYSFNLRKPHGKKGKAMFYPELRTRALRHLEKLGITKEVLKEGK